MCLIKNSAIAHRAFLLYNILMNSKTPSLKNIFSNFFFEYWEQIKFNFDEKRRKNIWKNVCAFLRCGNPKFGYAEYICPDCFEKLVVPFTCKSKFCPSCGIVYAEKWAHSLHEQLFNVQHLHITFSLPVGFIRDFFFFQQFKLRELADAAYSAIKYTFKKIGIHQVGVIINIHTFARDTSWNPHIHAIVTHGGLDINNNWKTPKSFPWTVFRKSWQKCSLDILSIHAKETKNINLKNKISLAYKKYQNGFYVNSENFVNNIENIAKYLGRYLARPAIADYRIVSFNHDFVKFWFQTPDSNKKNFLILETKKFIGRLVSHIAPKNFKMIRRYGLYSRRAKKRKIKTFSFFRKMLTWTERIYRDFKRNPLSCNKCGTSMELMYLYHYKYGFFLPKIKIYISPP
ncbi:MAG: transposase [Fusobacterium sp.]|uniref:IS91 family transposase n=2 Tax=Fusobacterium sp. TaxID=68766 RepID=UPI0039927E56